MTEASELKSGKKAPAIKLPDQTGAPVSLADFAGQMVLIYFYPKDDTPGCTQQACALNDNLKKLEKLNLQVLGISKDSTASHQKFATKFNLEFPLLSDKDGDVCERYGVWMEKSMYGKKYMGIERSSFLVGPDGKILDLWRGVKPAEHLAWAMKAAKA